MDFGSLYKKLNQRQKQAVDTLDGPLLVIAGPGTGKTQLLSARVASILEKTDAQPQNILCLTFTEKAATNMRERIISMIGPDARKVVVKTFHGLGSEIINEYPDYFYNAAKLNPAPDAVRLDYVDTLLSRLPLDNPLALRFAGQNTLVSDVQKAISRAKEAGLTPAKLLAVTQANLAYIKDIAEPLLQPLLDQRLSDTLVKEYASVVEELPDQGINISPIPDLGSILKQSLSEAIEAAQELGKSKPLTDWKADWSEVKDDRRVLKDGRRNEWWKALAGVYKDYQSMMHQNGYFDFADMILEVIVQLEQNETLRNDLQERFSYIMIDEFQDTNDAQFRLSYLLADHPAAEGRPNIMAVGDDDQAIYRFQGAEISNAQNFIDSFRDTKLIVLTENYRSHQSIIDASSLIADKIEHRLASKRSDIDKKITAKGDSPKGKVQHISYATHAHEISAAVDLIRQLYEKNNGSVAVLARKHGSLQQLALALHEAKVPIRYERKSNILDHEAVLLINQLLRLLLAIQRGNQEAANHLLSIILPNKAFGLDAVALWELAIKNRQQRADWLTSLIRHDNQAFKQLGEWLLELSREAQSQPLAVTIEHCLGLRQLQDFTSPLKQHLLHSQMTDEYVQTISALQSLRSLAAEYARQEPNLESFIRFMELNSKHGVVIADESAFVTGERAVELMTLHKAKGLEFDSVIVIDATDSDWSPGASRRKTPKNLETLQEYGEDADDYGRMMYVAATRAKSNLIFTSYRSNEHGTDVLSSPLIHEIERIEVDKEDEDLVPIIETATLWPQLNHSNERLLLLPLVERYKLSATNLLNFLDLQKNGPRYFIERNLLRLPDIKTPALAYGTAIHAALKLAQNQTNATGLQFALIQKEFEEELKRQQLETVEETRYLQKGNKLLEKLLVRGLLELHKGSEAERSINDVRLGKATLSGSLDRIDVKSDGSIVIVDYKTGSPLAGQLTTRSKTEGMKAWKHRMQLVFYALLAREKGLVTNETQITGQMVYVESEKRTTFIREYQPTKQDLVQMEQLIYAVWECIETATWPDTAGYETNLSGTEAFIESLITKK